MVPGNSLVNFYSPACSLNRALGVVVFLALSLTACSQNQADNQQATGTGRSLLSRLRSKADPNMVAKIIEEEREHAKSQAQASILTETGGAEEIESGLGRNLPGVSTEPFSQSLIAPPAESVNANGTLLSANNNQNATSAKSAATAHASYQPVQSLATYESAYSSVPPPPPGALGGGLVPPPPAVTLSTQAQAVNDSTVAFYNNPYFNPFGVPAPPQANLPARRPAGLFGDGNPRQDDDAPVTPKHKADFVPITPKGMEARSPYKQRDDLRVLWKGLLKNSNGIGELAENRKVLEQLQQLDVGLPADSTKGSFTVNPRLADILFKTGNLDKRVLPEVRKVQAELLQAYYRYLSVYNKYALAEQTVAARKQEINVAESDAEKQRAAADLAQSQSDIDAAKEDLRSAEIELAVASSPVSARSVISRVAGIAPSVESLAQGVAQNGSHTVAHTRRLINLFEVFKHNHNDSSTTNAVADLPENPNVINKSTGSSSKKKAKASEKKEEKPSLFGRMLSHEKSAKHDTNQITDNQTAAKDDLEASPSAKPVVAVSAPHHVRAVDNSPSTINFSLKNVVVNPRKSVLTVTLKNSGSEPFELNPDAIYIAEGSRKLGSAALRTEFDITSIEPDQEVKGTITIFSRPWNDRLVIYLADGNKTIQLKR